MNILKEKNLYQINMIKEISKLVREVNVHQNKFFRLKCITKKFTD